MPRIVIRLGIFGCVNLDNELRYAQNFLKQVREEMVAQEGTRVFASWERRLPVALSQLAKIEAKIVEFDAKLID